LGIWEPIPYWVEERSGELPDFTKPVVPERQLMLSGIMIYWDMAGGRSGGSGRFRITDR